MGHYRAVPTNQIWPSQDFLKERTLGFILTHLRRGELDKLPPPPIVRHKPEGEGYIAIDGHNLIAVYDYLGKPLKVYVAESADDQATDTAAANPSALFARNQDLRNKFNSAVTEAERVKIAGVTSFGVLRSGYPEICGPPLEYVQVLLQIKKSGQYVFQRRDQHAPTAPGMLGLFGGMAEAGETPEQAMVRELREETSLDPSKLSLKLLRTKEATSLANPADKRLRRGYLFAGVVESADFAVYEGIGTETYPLEEVLLRDDVALTVRFLLDPLPKT